MPTTKAWPAPWPWPSQPHGPGDSDRAGYAARRISSNSSTGRSRRAWSKITWDGHASCRPARRPPRRHRSSARGHGWPPSTRFPSRSGRPPGRWETSKHVSGRPWQVSAIATRPAPSPAASWPQGEPRSRHHGWKPVRRCPRASKSESQASTESDSAFCGVPTGRVTVKTVPLPVELSRVTSPSC